MSPPLQRPERDELEHVLYDIENVYAPVRCACELVLLRKLHAICCREAVAQRLPYRVRRVLERIPAPDAKEQWDALARAGVVVMEPPTQHIDPPPPRPR